MMVVTVARKPLTGTVARTTTLHGTGALNINACRIPVGGEILQGGAGGLLSNVRDQTEWGHHAGPEDNGYTPASGGRWPANVILEHHPACRPGPVVEVRAGKTPDELGSRPAGFGNVGSERGTNRPNAPEYGDQDGLERVVTWRCVAGCPAASLDGQHGATGGAHRTTRADEARVDETLWRLKPTAGTVRDFGDRGLVSRYFKMVQEVES